MNRSEHRPVGGVRNRDLDLHQARGVDDDPVERVVFADERDELAFVKGLHLVEPNDEPRPPHERPAAAEALAVYQRTQS